MAARVTRLFPLVGIVSLILAGCATPPRPTPAPPPPTAETPRYVPLDAAARDQVEAKLFFVRRLADGRLEVVVNLRSRAGAPVRLQAQCVFFGGAAPARTAWQPVELGPGETVSVRFTAPAPAFERYSIAVR